MTANASPTTYNLNNGFNKMNCSARTCSPREQNPPKFFEPGAVAYVHKLAQNILTPEDKNKYHNPNATGIYCNIGGYSQPVYTGCVSGCTASAVSAPFRSRGTMSPW